MPAVRRVTSPRGVSPSTSMRANATSSSAIASSATARSMPRRAMNSSSRSNSASGLPSSSTTRPSSMRSDGSGSFGLANAIRPSAAILGDEVVAADRPRRVELRAERGARAHGAYGSGRALSRVLCGSPGQAGSARFGVLQGEIGSPSASPEGNNRGWHEYARVRRELGQALDLDRRWREPSCSSSRPSSLVEGVRARASPSTSAAGTPARSASSSSSLALIAIVARRRRPHEGRRLADAGPGVARA